MLTFKCNQAGKVRRDLNSQHDQIQLNLYCEAKKLIWVLSFSHILTLIYVVIDRWRLKIANVIVQSDYWATQHLSGVIPIIPLNLIQFNSILFYLYSAKTIQLSQGNKNSFETGTTHVSVVFVRRDVSLSTLSVSNSAKWLLWRLPRVTQ